MNRESLPLIRTMDALLLGAILVLTFLLACVPNQDMDIWWHLATGRAILEGKGIPTEDTRTIAAAGHEWIDLHWLFEVGVAFVHARGGMEALTVAAAMTAALAVAASVVGSSSRAVAPFLLILWLPALVVLSARFMIRPEIVTLACLAIYLWVLRRAEVNPKRLWWLVPVQLLWVNVQGLFCFGPFLLACWLVDRWVHAPPEQRPRFRNETALPALAVVVACFANPYGWRGALYPLALARTMFIDGSFYRTHIGELASPLAVWQATAYRDPYIWGAFVLLMMAACSFLASEACLRIFRVTVFAVFCGLGLTAVRNLPQFALVAAFILAVNLADRPSLAEHARRYGLAIRLASLAMAVMLSWSVATGSCYDWIGSNRVMGLKESPHWHAHDAARFAARAGMPEGIVAYHEGQAGLVEFHMREEQRVYVDPRLEVMQRPAMEAYYRLAEAIAKADENWQDRIALPATILVDHTSHFPLEATLLSNPDWTCVWFDPVAACYVPKSAGSTPRDPSGDLARRHFGESNLLSRDAQEETHQLRDGLNSALMEATALLNIARSAGSRPTEQGIDRRVLLLLSARIARDAINQLPYEACRIGAGAAFQMYAVPTTSPKDWQVLEMTGPSRARYLLQRCQELRPRDFASIAEEYQLVSALGDPDATYVLSRRLLASKARTGQEVRFRSLVQQGLNVAHYRAAAGPGSVVDPTAEVETQVRELFESRRFLQIKSRYAAEMSGAEAESSGSTARDLVAKACLACGDPASAREIWRQTPGAEGDSYTAVCLGLTYLAEQDHTRALEQFGEAVRKDPSNVDGHCALAVCYLELGNASGAVDECDRALDDPNSSEAIRQFCERMRDFAARYRTTGE